MRVIARRIASVLGRADVFIPCDPQFAHPILRDCETGASGDGMTSDSSARSFRDRCAIVGVGNSRLGKVPGVSSLDLLIEAIKNAIDDAGLDGSAIDGIVSRGKSSELTPDLLIEAMKNAIDDAGLDVSEIDGIVSRGPHSIYTHHQQIGARLGINARFSTTLDNGGAGQILGVVMAVMAIESGMATTVICGCGGDAWSRTHRTEEDRVFNQTQPASILPKEFGPEYGYFGAVAAHAFGAQRHMDLYGTTREHFAEIAIACREHATRNPDAMMKRPITLDDYFKARLVGAPFGLPECSLRSDRSEE